MPLVNVATSGSDWFTARVIPFCKDSNGVVFRNVLLVIRYSTFGTSVYISTVAQR